MITRFFRFGLVGAMGMCIDFGLTWLCREKLRMNQFVANSIGFSVAVVNNYLLNRYWTFNNLNTQVASQFSTFLFVSLVGLALNNLLLYLFVKKIKLRFYYAKFVVIGIVFFWNYFANTFITFR
jgi:putative flippase GtrA